MSNRTDRLLGLAHGASFGFLAYAAGEAVALRAWAYAAGFAAASAVSLVAGWRDPDQHDRRPRPGTAAEDAAALTPTCTCDLWWASMGTAHDAWCPNRSRSSST